MNAKVYSVALDGTETRAEAVAVKDGKFVFIGSNEDAKTWIGENTQVTDCNGGSLLPGFGDAHMHLTQSAAVYAAADIHDLVEDFVNETPDDVIAKIQKIVKKFADEHPNDPVIHVAGWDRMWFVGGLKGIVRPFTRYDLDAAVSDRPVFATSYCGHCAVLNSKAMELAGIAGKDTPEPPAGVLSRDKDGVPDGYLQENEVLIPARAAIPNFAYTSEQIHEAMLRALKDFRALGFTLLCDMQEFRRITRCF